MATAVSPLRLAELIMGLQLGYMLLERFASKVQKYSCYYFTWNLWKSLQHPHSRSKSKPQTACNRWKPSNPLHSASWYLHTLCERWHSQGPVCPWVRIARESNTKSEMFVDKVSSFPGHRKKQLWSMSLWQDGHLSWGREISTTVPQYGGLSPALGLSPVSAAVLKKQGPVFPFVSRRKVSEENGTDVRWLVIGMWNRGGEMLQDRECGHSEGSTILCTTYTALSQALPWHFPSIVLGRGKLLLPCQLITI